jgi:hypothetical protein
MSMPATVERLKDLPVIHVKYYDSISVEDVQSVFANSQAQLRPDDSFMYRIIQFENVESNFAEILHIARYTATNAPNVTSDARYEVILVGHDRWTKLYIEMMNQKQFGSRAIPCFVQLDQALDYVRNQLTEQGS